MAWIGTGGSNPGDVWTNGKIGAGTTSPSGKLTVQGGTPDAGDLFNVNNASGNLIGRIYQDGSRNGVLHVLDSAASVKIQLYSTGASYFIGQNAGVGIGTSTIGTAKLGVVSLIEGNAVSVYAGYNSANTTAISGSSPSGTGVFGGTDNTGGGGIAVYGKAYGGGVGGKFYSSGSGMGLYVEGGRAAFAGNVGIGFTSAPSQALDVNGNGRFRSVGSGTCYAPLNLTSDGTLTVATSDKRKKKNIKKIDGVLSNLAKLRGVSFQWKDTKAKGKRIGMIAQEVEKVYPELVFTNPTDGYKGIRYAEMTAVLVEAMKEQQKRIEILEKELSLGKEKKVASRKARK